MKDKLYIDNKDAYLEYGVFVEQNGYGGVIQMPRFKKLDETEWEEYDGVETDLIEPALDAKTFQIKFCITNVQFAEDLFVVLSDGSYHTFDFRELKRSYRLRLTSNKSFSSLIRLGKLSLSFSDDFPAIPETEHYELGASGVRIDGYEIDGIDVSQFGSYVVKGSDDAIRRAPDVRKNLTTDIKSVAGVIYDGEEVRFKAKDVAIKMLINATDIDEFWRRWDSLFAILLKPEHRAFHFPKLNLDYECYYLNNSVTKFDILQNGHVWCEFTVTLKFTSYRPTDGNYLLIAESGDYIITEDGFKIIIRPKYL